VHTLSNEGLCSLLSLTKSEDNAIIEPCPTQCEGALSNDVHLLVRLSVTYRVYVRKLPN